MTRADILNIVAEEGFTPSEACVDYALKYYSYQNPLLKEEVFSDVYGKHEIQLSSELYSTLVIPKKVTDGYVQEFLNFRLHRDEGKIVFPYPYPFDELIVEYYTVHEFSEDNVTIPERHGQAFAYLICHFCNLEIVFGTDVIESVDDGVIKVKYSMAEKTKQKQRYLTKFESLMRAKSPEILVDRISTNTTYDEMLRW